MNFYKLPKKREDESDVFIDLDQVEVVSCRLHKPTPDIAEAIAGLPNNRPSIPLIRIDTVGGQNFEFSPGSIATAEEWLSKNFSLDYRFVR